MSDLEQQQKTKKYVYRDNSAGGIVVFECEANDILEADLLYTKATRYDPSKQSHVGCSIQ